jgi:formylglycine-generating enzyme required for sulfatase activity
MPLYRVLCRTGKSGIFRAVGQTLACAGPQSRNAVQGCVSPALIWILLCAPLAATSLRVVPLTPLAAGHIKVAVAWNNSWKNARNHDAAWVFLKCRAGRSSWQPGLIRAASAPPPAVVTIPEDRTGAFIHSAEMHRGAVDWTVEFAVDAGACMEWRAFGVEMVYIPEGPFSIGDTDAKALEMNAYYRSGEGGTPAGRFRIESEGEIAVGTAPGALNYRVAEALYQGDRQGPVPASFPKGFHAFYLMKYELTQGQYADFLNHIPEQASQFRAIGGGVGYAANRGSIAVEGAQYVARSPARPANWVSWNDGIAFAAWAGLRPYTEFEYTKASRGGADPVSGDYPWGTASKALLRRQIAPPDDDLAPLAESRLTDASREEFGASYYWVMDLAGSVWERVVTPASPIGRAFRGTHGNGRVTSFGSAQNEDWPKGDEGPGGYGYRGGGYYEHGFQAGELNPHSRTEWRRFGAWGQGPRSVAYGFRAARTAFTSPSAASR